MAVWVFFRHVHFHQVVWSKEEKKNEMQSMRETILQGKRAKLRKEATEIDEEQLEKEVCCWNHQKKEQKGTTSTSTI